MHKHLWHEEVAVGDGKGARDFGGRYVTSGQVTSCLNLFLQNGNIHSNFLCGAEMVYVKGLAHDRSVTPFVTGVGKSLLHS